MSKLVHMLHKNEATVMALGGFCLIIEEQIYYLQESGTLPISALQRLKLTTMQIHSRPADSPAMVKTLSQKVMKKKISDIGVEAF